MMDYLLPRLQQWYARHCDGDWEHNRGIVIESCDNPGWWVRIDLRGTELADQTFIPILDGDDDPMDPNGDWLRCYVGDNCFNGAGDPSKLQAILSLFLEWAIEKRPQEDVQPLP